MISPDTTSILYAANQESATRTDLFRADLATLGSAAKLNPTMVEGGGVVNFHISPDGTRVGYTANQDDAGVYELYEVTLLAPGTAQKLSAPMKMGRLFLLRVLGGREAGELTWRIRIATRPGVSRRCGDAGHVHPPQWLARCGRGGVGLRIGSVTPL